MPTGHYVLAIVLVLAVAAFAALTVMRAAPQPVQVSPVIQVQNPQDSQRNTLTVTGSAEITVSPDQAIAYVSVISEKKTAKDAQTANRDVANGVIDALKKWGVNASDIETQTYSLDKIQEWDSNNNRYIEKGYRLTHTLKVTTKRINDVGDLIDTSVNAGANGVDSITFSLTNEAEKKALNEVLSKAAVEAKDKAGRLADASGVALGRVASVTEQGNYVPIYYNTANMKLDSMAASPTQISPQKVDVSGSVQMVYEIK